MINDWTTWGFWGTKHRRKTQSQQNSSVVIERPFVYEITTAPLYWIRQIACACNKRLNVIITVLGCPVSTTFARPRLSSLLRLMASFCAADLITTSACSGSNQRRTDAGYWTERPGFKTLLCNDTREDRWNDSHAALSPGLAALGHVSAECLLYLRGRRRRKTIQV